MEATTVSPHRLHTQNTLHTKQYITLNKTMDLYVIMKMQIPISQSCQQREYSYPKGNKITYYLASTSHCYL